MNIKYKYFYDFNKIKNKESLTKIFNKDILNSNIIESYSYYICMAPIKKYKVIVNTKKHLYNNLIIADDEFQERISKSIINAAYYKKRIEYTNNVYLDSIHIKGKIYHFIIFNSTDISWIEICKNVLNIETSKRLMCKYRYMHYKAKYLSN